MLAPIVLTSGRSIYTLFYRLSLCLRAPDADILLDLAAAFRVIYDRAGYDLSVNYATSLPPPMLSQEEQTWVRQRLQEHEVLDLSLKILARHTDREKYPSGHPHKDKNGYLAMDGSCLVCFVARP